MSTKTIVEKDGSTRVVNTLADGTEAEVVTQTAPEVVTSTVPAGEVITTSTVVSKGDKGETITTVTRPDGTVVATTTPAGVYEGTLRVVTEADILGDPRLVAASVVAGQLYDFSNLPYVKDGVEDAYVEEVNRKKAQEVLVEQNPAVPPFTSEVERAELNAKFATRQTESKVASKKAKASA